MSPNPAQVILSQNQLASQVPPGHRNVPEIAINQGQREQQVKRRVQLQRAAEKEPCQANFAAVPVFGEQEVRNQKPAEDEEQVDPVASYGGPDRVSGHMHAHYQQNGEAAQHVEFENALCANFRLCRRLHRHLQRIGVFRPVL